jgi:hypothetical protein
MGNIERQSGTSAPQKLTISLQLLGGFALVFILGLTTHLLARNFFSGQALTFSTPELLNFVLSVLLSGASIFLAIAAIALGRFSEQAIVQRSDESIRLQNEVFQKTTDALQRIESSTGVTEKRIEDIISGRVGDLSQKIARIATETQDPQGKDQGKDVEAAIRKALYETLREEGITGRSFPNTPSAEEISLRNRNLAEKLAEEEYGKASTAFMQALSVRSDLKAVKMSRGHIGKPGDEMYDGIYVLADGTRIGIVDFGLHHSANTINTAITGVLRDLQNNNVKKAYVVYYGPKERIEPTFNEVISVIDPKLKNRISLIICPPDQITQVAKDLQIS